MACLTTAVSTASSCGRPSAWLVSRAAVASAVVGLAVFSVESTSEGLGLPELADAATGGTPGERAELVRAAHAIAAATHGPSLIGMALLIGVPLTLFGLALALDTYPSWLGWTGTTIGAASRSFPLTQPPPGLRALRRTRLAARATLARGRRHRDAAPRENASPHVTDRRCRGSQTGAVRRAGHVHNNAEPCRPAPVRLSRKPKHGRTRQNVQDQGPRHAGRHVMYIEGGGGWVLPMARTGGPIPGRAQRGREATYDPDSGLPYRTSASFDPETAVKLIQAAEKLHMSISGFLAEAVRRLEVDEDGRPLWTDELAEDEGRLPLQEAS